MTSSAPLYFRRRTIGRAASPPTWACYEQIPYDEDSYSESGSDSESDDDDDGHDSSSDNELDGIDEQGQNVDSMDIDHSDEDEEAKEKKNVKGKQKAAEQPEEPPKRKHHKKKREHVVTLRPILTIQRSQGFVWNQDLFVPPYIKDRYVASTSPPNSGFISTSASSTTSALNDYEVEVVEIRVQEGELDHIIP